MRAVALTRKVEMPASPSGYNAYVVVLLRGPYEHIGSFRGAKKGCKGRACYLAFISHFITHLADISHRARTADKGFYEAYKPYQCKQPKQNVYY